MSKINLEIVTPERIVYSDTVDMVTAPSLSGSIGILPRHIPLFAQLTEGELKIKKDNEEIYLSIGGGFIEITKNKVLILVTRAHQAQELNEREIIKAKDEAQQALNQKEVKGVDYTRAQAIFRQSIVDLRILRKRKKGFGH